MGEFWVLIFLYIFGGWLLWKLLALNDGCISIKIIRMIAMSIFLFLRENKKRPKIIPLKKRRKIVYRLFTRSDFKIGVKEKNISGVIMGKLAPAIFTKFPKHKISVTRNEKVRSLLFFPLTKAIIINKNIEMPR